MPNSYRLETETISNNIKTIEKYKKLSIIPKINTKTLDISQGMYYLYFMNQTKTTETMKTTKELVLERQEELDALMERRNKELMNAIDKLWSGVNLRNISRIKLRELHSLLSKMSK